MKGIFGHVYDFFPQAFSLPNDYVRFVRVYAEEEEQGNKVFVFLPFINIFLTIHLLINKIINRDYGFASLPIRVEVERFSYFGIYMISRMIASTPFVSSFYFFFF